MSSNGYDKALPIELNPSRWHKKLIFASHLSTVLPVLFLSSQHMLYLVLFLPLLYSLHRAYRGHINASRWKAMRLHADGRVVLFDGVGQQVVYLLRQRPTLYSRLIILPLLSHGHGQWMPLFADAVKDDQWRELQVYLRFHLLLSEEARA